MLLGTSARSLRRKFTWLSFSESEVEPVTPEGTEGTGVSSRTSVSHAAGFANFCKPSSDFVPPIISLFPIARLHGDLYDALPSLCPLGMGTHANQSDKGGLDAFGGRRAGVKHKPDPSVTGVLSYGRSPCFVVGEGPRGVAVNL